ncbi:MAG: fibronectin type III-like domain-contianing protein, partial [Xanthomonadales bacterium]|nr:fibronectin type III-like domain-contianing protein [Xanthomonadales bacterium]
SQRLSFTLRSADLRRYDEAVQGYVVSPGDYELRLGASSADIRQRVRLQVRQ